MKKIYSTPIVKVAEIDAESIMLQIVSGEEAPGANNDFGSDANKRESNDGLFDW